jgi:hypothetical protein
VSVNLRAVVQMAIVHQEVLAWAANVKQCAETLKIVPRESDACPACANYLV